MSYVPITMNVNPVRTARKLTNLSVSGFRENDHNSFSRKVFKKSKSKSESENQALYSYRLTFYIKYDFKKFDTRN